jgi:hypothetical protein
LRTTVNQEDWGGVRKDDEDENDVGGESKSRIKIKSKMGR